MSADSIQAEIEDARAELEDVLSYHNGDALAAVRSLLNDCRNLRHRLAITNSIVSRGYARGWRAELD